MTADSTVMVLDDDTASRESLQWLIESVGLNAKTYGAPRDFLDSFLPGEAGCLVLDLRMPQMSGIEVLKRLRDGGHKIPVIMITAHGDVPTVVEAMKGGAVEFLEKPFNNQVLLDRIHQCLRDDAKARAEEAKHADTDREVKLIHQCLGDDAKARAEEAKHADTLMLLASLTPREREVMTLIVDGNSNKQIARILDISPKTVEVHRAHIMEKIKAKRRSLCSGSASTGGEPTMLCTVLAERRETRRRP